MDNIVISSFYQFFNLNNYESAKTHLLNFCKEQNLKGTILIAQEGINATISGHRNNVNNLYQFLSNHYDLKKLPYKESFANSHPFERMKVRIKSEIVAMGVSNLDYNHNGQYIEPKDWDTILLNPEVITIDTRNNYEVALGKFNNAINPATKTFRQFPSWAKENLDPLKHKKVAMYCTGGIRCEKSTAYLKSLGFDEVYHLKGGILNYIEYKKGQESNWQGDCFVFDDRIAVNSKLEPIEDISCQVCNIVIKTDDIKSHNGKSINMCRSCHPKYSNH